MHIVAILRLVPDVSGDLSVAGDGKSLDREWIDVKLNEFDDHALEQAVLLKESEGASVTALAPDDDGVDRLLQTALARGADQVFKLEKPQGELSSRSLALQVAAATRTLKADLVLTGVQSPDEVHGQLAAYLGAALGWPQASAINGVRVDADHVLARQEFGGGYASTLRIALPAVLGIQTASQPIRYVAGSKLRQFVGAKVDLIKADVSLEPLEPEIVALAAPERRSAATMLEGESPAVAGKILELLIERGLVGNRHGQ